MNQIIGVTFPIPKQYLKRFFEDNKSIFVKPATCFKQLKPGMKFVFYQSREDTGFVGEGIIVNISLVDDPLLLFERIDERLFLTKEEIQDYIDNQNQWKSIRIRKDKVKKKKWLIIELSDIKKYKKVKKPVRFVPVSGHYLRE